MECVYKEKGREYPYLDCYGLCKYLYEKEHNVVIPDFNYTDVSSPDNEKYYLEELNNPKWVEVKQQKGAIVALRTNGHVKHCGYMVSDTEFVHIMKRTGVCRVKVTSPSWRNRIEGYYKYA